MSTAVFVNQDGVRLLGKNQDVPYDGAYFFTNKRGVHKTAMIMPPDRPMVGLQVRQPNGFTS